MEKLVLLILAALSLSFSSEERGVFLDCQKEKSELDESLKQDEAVFTFRFTGIENGKGQLSILYSIDSVEHKERLIGNKHIVVKTTPGKHIFQFFYDEDYFEITTDSLEIKPQYHDYYAVFFQSSKFPVIVDKPIVYVYPEKRQKTHVSLDAKGTDLFEYPKFNNLRHDLLTWSVTANPNGDIELNGETYNYLFWESKQDAVLTPEELTTGFVVQGTDVADFFENKLTEVGFTAKERADFITYWAPRLRSNDQTFIHFMFGKRCDKFAQYIIEPEPDNFYRLYIAWTPVDSNFRVNEQELTSLQRKGFTVLEWGGFEFETNFSQLNDN